MIEKNINGRKSILALSALGIISTALALLVNVTLPVIILSLMLLYKITPLPRRINYPTIRAAVTIVLQLTIFNAFGLIFYLIHMDVTAATYGILSLAMVGAVFIAQTLSKKTPTIGKLSKFDLITILPVVLGAVILLVYIFCNSLSFSENIVRFMGSSSDQSAHLSMFNDILRNHGNYVYSSEKMSINTSGINSYPMGWHQAAAVLSSNALSVDVTAGPFVDVMVVYFICALFTFLLCGLIISALTGLVYDRVYAVNRAGRARLGGYSLLSEISIKTFVVLSITFLFTYIIFCELGYVNFMYATVIAMLCGVFTIGLSKSSDISLITISMLAILLFAAVEAWYLMGIPLGIVLMSIVAIYLKSGNKITFRRHHALLLSVSFILLGLAFFAILRNIITDGSGGQIMVGDYAYSWLPDSLVVLGITIIAVILSNRNKTDLFRVFVNSFFVSIALLTALNFLSLQTYSYYQQKMIYAFFALCIPLTFIAVIKYLRMNGVQPILTMVIIPFFIYTINPSGIIHTTQNILRPTSDPEIGIIDKYFRSEFNDRSAVIFIKDYRTSKGRYAEPYARLQLSKVVSPGDCYNRVIMPLLIVSKRHEVGQEQGSRDADKAVIECYGNAKFFILADDRHINTEDTSHS